MYVNSAGLYNLKHAIPKLYGMLTLPDGLLINAILYVGLDLKGYVRINTVWPPLGNLFPVVSSLEVELRSGELKNIDIVNKLSFVRNMTINCCRDVIPDISALQTLTNLTSLRLLRCSGLSDISSINQLRLDLPATRVNYQTIQRGWSDGAETRICCALRV